jgi:hypothetical protein
MIILLYFIKIKANLTSIQKVRHHIGLLYHNLFPYKIKFKGYSTLELKFPNSILNYWKKSVIWQEKWDLIKNNYIFKFGIEVIKTQLLTISLF